mmetsp:Transcript_6519/g.13111  ORF Transcript_6519/g.13111 Transcript_6519/m.13111 type:complete len:96 (-) Transcript_6519:597-884(-)
MQMINSSFPHDGAILKCFRSSRPPNDLREVYDNRAYFGGPKYRTQRFFLDVHDTVEDSEEKTGMGDHRYFGFCPFLETFEDGIGSVGHLLSRLTD